jgi:hypothetical protein
MKNRSYVKQGCILKINQVDENFDVQFYWWTRVDSIDLKQDYSFVKDIEIINADINSFDIVETKIDTINKSYFVTGFGKVTIPSKRHIGISLLTNKSYQFRLKIKTIILLV